MAWLINAAQLDKLRKNPKNVVILDASWHLPASGRDAKAEFLAKHISGAKFLDLNAFNDTSTDIPNMLMRDEARIKQMLGALGINEECKVLLYDNSDLHSSCRALWMLKTFGHPDSHLYILDGGFAAWERYGGKVEAGESRNTPAKIFTGNFQAHFIRPLIQMKTNLHHPTEQVVDMRHPVRYAGGAEHRKGLRAGHIPGSFSFPYMTMFETDGRFKPLDRIQKQLLGTGVDLSQPIVTCCGSGITATILNFVLDLLNHPTHSLYDGSWSEWGVDTLYHGETSLDERPVISSLDINT
jgi:thiosulfate/3-mercaptopyruvate sulfurtransferase